jgi:hypothetical protein
MFIHYRRLHSIQAEIRNFGEHLTGGLVLMRNSICEYLSIFYGQLNSLCTFFFFFFLTLDLIIPKNYQYRTLLYRVFFFF